MAKQACQARIARMAACSAPAEKEPTPFSTEDELYLVGVEWVLLRRFGR
jgi:hypothetical protein